MRRSTAAVLGVTAGAALLLGAKVGTRPHPDLGAVVTGPPGGHAPGGAAGVASGAPGPLVRSPGPGGAVPGASPGPAGPGGAAGTPAATGAATAGAGQPATAAPPGSSALRSGVFTGVAVTHKYGTLQVTITVSSGRIIDASTRYTTSLRLSAQINADALPKLRQEALAAQSADIDTVSGATYTSNAYRSSLQSALDRARG